MFIPPLNSDYPIYFPLLKLNFKDMLAKAEVFANGDLHLFEEIKNILYNPDFQNNPELYLSIWDELRYLKNDLEDVSIRMFFNENKKFFQ